MAKPRVLTWACACQASVTATAVKWITRCTLHLDGTDEFQDMAIDAVQDRQSDPSAPARVGDLGRPCPDCGGPVSKYSSAGARCRKCYEGRQPQKAPRPPRSDSPRPAQTCPQCGVSFIPIGPRKCCSPACSRARWLAQVRAREETRDYAAEYARRAARATV